jgi:phosphoketolase
MLEIEIPRDVREYQPKMFGNFTARQVLCLIACVIIFGLTTVIEQRLLHLATLTYIPAFPLVVVPLAFGWGDKIVGMPVEKYIRLVFVNNVAAPKHRAYKTHNYLEMEFHKMQQEAEFVEPDQVNKKKKEQAKYPTGKNVPVEFRAYP